MKAPKKMDEVVPFYLVEFQTILLECQCRGLGRAGEVCAGGERSGSSRVRACRLLTPSNEGRIRSLQRQ